MKNIFFYFYLVSAGQGYSGDGPIMELENEKEEIRMLNASDPETHKILTDIANSARFSLQLQRAHLEIIKRLQKGATSKLDFLSVNLLIISSVLVCYAIFTISLKIGCPKKTIVRYTPGNTTHPSLIDRRNFRGRRLNFE